MLVPKLPSFSLSVQFSYMPLPGWSGLISVWNAAGCSKKLSARAHEDRCTDVAWHPAANLSQEPGAVNLATGCADSTAALLSGSGTVWGDACRDIK